MSLWCVLGKHNSGGGEDDIDDQSKLGPVLIDRVLGDYMQKDICLSPDW